MLEYLKDALQLPLFPIIYCSTATIDQNWRGDRINMNHIPAIFCARRVLWPVAFLLAGLLCAPEARAQEQAPQARGEITLSFAPVVRKVAPSVVNIYTRKVIEERQSSPFFDDPFFRQFFGEGFGQNRARVQNSLGSGVIVRPDGLIVTNNHVIQGADQITVVLHDNREFEAKVVAAEPRLDLALLRINTKGEKLPDLAIRDSDELEVGDLVLAIGNPFGVGQTVTSGIVSALARTNTGIGDFGFFIQTDAAINPGNSGGALVSGDGRLVGINTAIYSKSGGSVGIGFAIPSAMVSAVIAAEANGGKLVRPWIGLSGEVVTSEIAASMKLDRPQGVVVREVYPGGPAARAGVMPGDVVLLINDRPVADPGALRFRLATLPVGKQAQLSVIRHGAPIVVTVDLLPPPGDPAPDERLLKGEQPLNGVLVANLSPALSDILNIGQWSGVVIEKILQGSFADRLGLMTGDILVKLNDQEIKTTAGLEAQLRQPTKSWRIAVSRGGKVKVIEVK